ncbi:hypothetical protein EI067_28810 [Mycobacterium paragordonae]|nr:hypothetical protein EI067_28810 [Mycobacterium paragordonae]
MGNRGAARPRPVQPGSHVIRRPASPGYAALAIAGLTRNPATRFARLRRARDRRGRLASPGAWTGSVPCAP